LELTEFYLDMKEEAAMANFKSHKEEVENEEDIKKKKLYKLFVVDNIEENESYIFTNLKGQSNQLISHGDINFAEMIKKSSKLEKNRSISIKGLQFSFGDLTFSFGQQRQITKENSFLIDISQRTQTTN